MCMEFQSYFQTKSTQLSTHWKNKALLPNIEKRDKCLGHLSPVNYQIIKILYTSN